MEIIVAICILLLIALLVFVFGELSFLMAGAVMLGLV